MKQCVEKHIRYEKVLCKNFVKIVALNPTIALFVFVFKPLGEFHEIRLEY